MPADYKELLKLPGIGSYTAGAIASIAFSIPVPAVDGNVLRVVSRFTENREDMTKPAEKKKIEVLLTETMDQMCIRDSRNTALISVLMLTGWRCIGYGMMIYLSAMMGISTDYYEAASLDGANSVQKFFKITLPMLSTTTLFLFVTTFISSMKVFQSVDILTQGGPYRSTEVFVYNIYRYAMVDFRMDRASTVAIFFFVLLLLVTVATMKISKGNVTYDS